LPTYAQVATTTLTTTTATITFSSLGSYTDLFIIASTQGTRTTYGGDFGIRFNGDSGGNYIQGFTRGSSSGASASSYTGLNEINLGGALGGTGSNNFSLFYIFLPNYRNTSVHKTIHAFDNGAGTEHTQTDYTIGAWANTAAITSFLFLNPSYNFVAGTTISLYGILAA